MTLQTKFRHKLLLVLIGLLSTFVLIEGGMRLTGWAISFAQGVQNRIAVSREGTYRILCLGESTTFSGVMEHSYPAALERILNSGNSDLKFSVINGGVIGTITENILFGLEENIERYSPDMVITMIGINDDRYDVLENRNAELATTGVGRFFAGLKVVRLIKHIKLHAQAKHGEDDAEFGDDFWNYDVSDVPVDQLLELAFEQMDAMNFTVAQNLFRKALETNSNNPDIYSALGGIWAYRGQHDKAMLEFQKALAIDPAHEETYAKMVDRFYYNRDYAQAEQTIRTMLKHVPDSQQAYEGLAQIYFKQKEYGKLKGVLETAQQMFPENYLLAKVRASYRLSDGKEGLSKVSFTRAENLGFRAIKPATISNYRQIRDVVLKQGARLIAVQYPMRSIDPLRSILESDARVEFVNNEDVFKKGVQVNGYEHYFVDNFAGDFGHLTPMGNDLLASTIAVVVKKSLY